MFTDTDMAILGKVRELAQQGAQLDSIADELGETTKHIIHDETAQQETALMVLNKFIERFENLNALTSETASRLDHLHAEFDDYKEQDRPWKEYLKRLHEWERLPWHKRIRTPRPEPPEEG